MPSVQTLVTPHGEELVVLTRADYDDLLARAERIEDGRMARLLRRTRGDVAIPADVWERIEGGEHPVRAIRRLRGMTQSALAEKAGVSQSYVADIESARKSGSAETLKTIARCLGVALDDLVV